MVLLLPDLMVHSAYELQVAFERLQKEIDKIKVSVDVAQCLSVVRMVNNKLMNIERAFILPEGLPGRPLIK